MVPLTLSVLNGDIFTCMIDKTYPDLKLLRLTNHSIVKLPVRKQAHPLSLFLDKWLESDGLSRRDELENVAMNMSL